MGHDPVGLERPELVRVLESAARLQDIVPDSVLVGGAAAALWASHRIRSVPLEVVEVELPSGHVLRVPTPDEMLRIKDYLVVRRNQVRDYLDVAAICDRAGIAHAAEVLRSIDDYYADQRGSESQGVATQLARQLADPRPADTRTIKQLGRYKQLDPRWTNCKNVTGVCHSVAVEMAR